ncbi:Leucine-rich repeat protein kinase family protein [Rhynchospora pubera]|uniref:Leucine-rich repeat protein kinase family protein n=1 Tax=Rhynchospora pubera TaxID=906938 RepID=A0AAV8HIZ6_9POAL|nr:Leucine-rich repeat protein kinase family protein [Rhynchospora pubera]
MEEFSPLLLSFLLLSLPLLGSSQFLAEDTQALFTFKSALATRSNALSSWTSNNYTCTAWVGVYCNSTDTGPRVFELRLPGIALSGAIPSSTISNLTSLRVLSLRHNSITSPLPDDLSVQKNITSLFINNNKFTGPIPTVLSSLLSLERLDLSSNNFSGEVPSSLNNLTQLKSLFLQDNNISGTLPQELNFPNLELFNISYNSNLSGPIPPSLTKFPASAFIGTKLCGGPLGPCTPTPNPSPYTPSPVGPPPTPSNNNNSNSLSAGAIAGIVIGAAAAFSVLVLLVVILFRKGQYDSQSARAKPPGPALFAGSTGTHQEAYSTPAVAQSDTAQAEPYSSAPASSTAGTVPAAPAATVATAVPAVPVSVPIGRKLAFFRKGEVPKFDLENLLRASAEVLGRGTFGTTYKAILESGDTVAVKRLQEVYLSEKDFREKVARVGELEHKNIVPLLAYYYSKDERLLVYDFMPMGSLSAVLHGNRGSGRTPLNWETRANIALAVSRGLHHIHSAGPTMSHGNIKSSNVLLTTSYEGRLSDHSLFSFASTRSPLSRVAGYRAPEITDPKKISQKADIYSFGVLVLELLTGKAPAQAVLNEEGVDLPRWVQSVLREDSMGDVFDMDLVRYQNAGEDMMQLLQLAVDCTKQFPDQRPNTAEIVERIEDIVKNRDVSASGSGTE